MPCPRVPCLLLSSVDPHAAGGALLALRSRERQREGEERESTTRALRAPCLARLSEGSVGDWIRGRAGERACASEWAVVKSVDQIMGQKARGGRSRRVRQLVPPRRL